MIEHLRALERSKRTIAVGSVAPGPIIDFVPSLSALFPDMSIVSEMKTEDELLNGIKNSMYQFIILSHPIEDDGLICEKYEDEQLYVSLPNNHRLAKKEKLSFAELNGESFLMLSEVGIWEQLVRQEMPDSKFIIQNDNEALGELIESSSLPNFATDITIRAYERVATPGRNLSERVLIPISDATASISFYTISDQEIAKKYRMHF